MFLVVLPRSKVYNNYINEITSHDVFLLFLLGNRFLARMGDWSNSSTSQDICTYSCTFLGVTKLECGYVAGFHELMVVLNCLAAPPTALANALVLIAIYRHPIMHSPANTLLGGLAFSDMVVGLIIEPIYIASLIASIRGDVHLSCILREFCYRAGFFFTPFSFLVVVCITIERWLALHLKAKFQLVVTKQRSLKLLILIGIFCLFVDSTWSWLPGRVCLAIATSGLVVCLVINIVVYTRIFLVLRSYRSRVRASESSDSVSVTNTLRFKKSVVTAFYIVLALCLCSFPYLGRNALRAVVGYTVEVFVIDHVTVSVLMLNSLINPFLYFWRNSGIRKASRNTLRRGAPNWF